MNDAKRPPSGNGPARSDLDVRLSEIERRVGRFLEPMVWPSLVTDIARADEVRSILRIGASFDLPPMEDSRPVVVDLLIGDVEAIIAIGRAELVS